MHIDWHHVTYGALYAITTTEHAAIPSAVAEGDHEAWFGHGVICLDQWAGHIPRDRTRHEQSVGMPG
jgi:hypothetical protein